MLTRFKVGIVSLAMSIGLAAVPAVAQPQFGLVNIDIDDVNVTVPIQAAVNIAANVCGTQVNVLALAIGQSAVCTSKAESDKLVQFTRVQ